MAQIIAATRPGMRMYVQPCALLACLLVAPAAFADSARAIMDAAGTKATLTGLARGTCFDDGSGPAAMLVARVRDNSPPLHGLMVSLVLLKGTTALSISDTVSGDAGYSDTIVLPGGNGEYTLVLNKTDIGVRSFDIEWHCMTAGSVHTGTDISVLQFK